MKSISIKNARENLATIVEDAVHGATTVITRRGKDVAIIAPVPSRTRSALPDLAEFRKGLRIKGKPLSEAVVEQRRPVKVLSMAYIDTSVLAAYYCPEPLSDPITRALQRLNERMISPLVEIELISAMALKTRTHELKTTAAKAIVTQFRTHLSAGLFEIVEIGATEYAIARDWLAAFTTPLRALDALHLAATFAHGTELWTADRSLASSAVSVGVQCKLFE